MLSITRKVNQAIQIGKDIIITITELKKGSVRMTIKAPLGTVILRTELIEHPPEDEQ